MLLFTLLMLATSALLIVLGRMIAGGRTDLIHAYHQKRVKDKAAYGKAMGRALCLMAIAPAVAGVLAQFTASAWPAAVLLLGIGASFLHLLRTQKKHNGGLF